MVATDGGSADESTGVAAVTEGAITFVRSRAVRVLAALTVAFAAAFLAGCGGGSDGASGGERATTQGAESDYLSLQLSHHAATLKTAQIAVDRAEHEEIRRLAASIVLTRTAEAAALRAMLRRLYGLRVDPGADPPDELATRGEALGRLGLPGYGLGFPPETSGITAFAAPLDLARPFDRAFIDLMVPLQQGAVRIARAGLKRVRDEPMRHLARRVSRAGACSIVRLNRFRAEWYGQPSPAGGVPPLNGGRSLAGRDREPGILAACLP